MMISPYVSLYLVTVYLTTCHRNWLGLEKPGKWNDFETRWNTSTKKQGYRYTITYSRSFLTNSAMGVLDGDQKYFLISFMK